MRRSAAPRGSTVQRFSRIAAWYSAPFSGARRARRAADLNGWKDVLETNVLGTMHMTQAVVPV
jgi:NAD(P)-dependent dehydrogenase (short-subunit alcohol dehydrogenase family)